MCQGTSKEHRGDPLDNENFHYTGGNLAVDIIGADVFDFAATVGKDGHTYSMDDGTDRIVRIIPFNKRRPEGETLWKDKFPGTQDPVQLHRVVLAVVHCFGGSVYEESSLRCPWRGGNVRQAL